MKLIITKSNPSVFWLLNNRNEVDRVKFPNFYEQDLAQPSPLQHRFPLPWEISSKILGYMFRSYLRAFNFDLAEELLLVRKDFVNLIYYSIYGRALVHYSEKFSRLTRTLYIISTLHDEYITVLRQRQYSIFKLVRRGDPGVDTLINPWDFTHDSFIEPLRGIVADSSSSAELHSVGPCYGDQVTVQGAWKRGIYHCASLTIPTINFKLVDIFDTLQLTHTRVRYNQNFGKFFKLVKQIYGAHAQVNVMIQDPDMLGDSDLNPFVSHSTTFISY